MKTFINSLIFTLTLTVVTFGNAFATPYYNNSGDDAPSTLFEHMQTTQLLQVTMEMDIETLIDNKKTNEFFPAKFSFKNSQGMMTDWDIEVRSRGRFRRMTCEFPPLKLKFPKKEMKAEGFGKHNDVKLVTHCMDDKKAVETLFREYLTYQLYAKLTDASFRTQLISITYRDSKTGAETSTYGILIEDADELAERMNKEECENCFGLTASAYNQSNLQIHDLYQYMIGNTDWSLKMARNMKVLNPRTDGGERLVAPYDFDFSGLVNADYAKPNADLQQKDVRDRYYIGADWTADEWTTTIKLFQDKKMELMMTIDQFDMLNNKAKKDMKKYLESFYSELDQGFIPQNYLALNGN
ncbi:hypothetical protein [Flavilitoribacter nigricans]|uniref:Uncharacterized protein n=1 Tax=Flavilitoribacter nigricans (strain ATCC 23147 / DSM 23189 / NBRC 102662 / NCIMB 1420 / SS-2) TaxID=1122177 RepID=A0A2D0N7D1_FLAN2|nr:hypothetical protein [Flavilitoribacter nigricans]PHN04421.1 hypothetical protein CRP01_20645 [Flavilitoribacter nigricans DSM 23189 = NBRC 102662]